MKIDEFLNKRIRRGDRFNAIFASVDIVGSSRLQGTPDQIAKTKNALRSFIEDLINTDPIAILSWRGDGGILISDASKDYERLVILCEKLVDLLPLFNRARNSLNYLPHDFIHLRVVCDEDFVVNTGDQETLTSSVLDALVKNERDVAFVDHVVVTHKIFRNLSSEHQLRLSQLKPPHEKLDICYTLDAKSAGITLQTSDPNSDIVREWIATSIRHGDYDEISVFSYTNESLYEYLASPLLNVNIRVLARNWLKEEEEETQYNKKIAKAAVRAGTTKEYITPWTKSKVIQSIAEILMETTVAKPFKNKIEVRFYDYPPIFKGVLLQNSKSHRRAAYFGFYYYEHYPARAHGGSPYVGDNLSGVWLSDDGGPKTKLLDALASRFEELWVGGKTYDELQVLEEEKPSALLPCIERVWSFDGKPYLIVYPTSKSENRPFPKIVTEDLMSGIILEKWLTQLGAKVDFEGVPEGILIDNVKKWKGHIIFLCHRTLTKEIRAYLDNNGFPFSITFKANNEGINIPLLNYRGNPQIFESPMDSNPPVAQDYCIVGKGDRPDNNNSKFFMIAGLHGLGTWGGCEYLTNKDHLKDLCGHVQGNNFSTLVMSTFDQPHKLKAVKSIFVPDEF